jgi:general secretion pathway protein G
MIMLNLKMLLNLLTDIQKPDAKYGVRTKAKDKHVPAPKPNGFTLVELMVVIFIIGLLTTIVVINVLPNQDKAMVQKAKADIAVLSQAMETYRLDNLDYPAAAQGLQSLVTPPPGIDATARRAGYIKKLPADPWNRPYQYANPGRNGGFDIYSLGADGTPGGENDNADIYSE